jgi:hypothetical protein
MQAELPYVEVLTDGRRLKTKQSLRKIPPAGAALAVMKWRPHFLLPPSAARRIAHGFVERSIERTVYRQWYRVDSGYFTLALALLDRRECHRHRCALQNMYLIEGER